MMKELASGTFSEPLPGAWILSKCSHIMLNCGGIGTNRVLTPEEEKMKGLLLDQLVSTREEMDRLDQKRKKLAKRYRVTLDFLVKRFGGNTMKEVIERIKSLKAK